jgi:hypothetical protein
MEIPDHCMPWAGLEQLISDDSEAFPNMGLSDHEVICSIFIFSFQEVIPLSIIPRFS